jgi:alpha-tubulin suppressor-like RCC1 family protein
VDIACGLNNSKAVTSDGRVFVWGANTEKLTQLGSELSKHSYPVQLTGIHQRIRAIASGKVSCDSDT